VRGESDGRDNGERERRRRQSGIETMKLEKEEGTRATQETVTAERAMSDRGESDERRATEERATEERGDSDGGENGV